jgi:2-iminobutanoate/2-iminopropanoate deaminase
MTRKAISTDKAPKAIGPYSQAVLSNDLLFVSGQLGIDPAKGALVEGIEAQTKQAMENLRSILQAAGMGFEDVVKTTIYVTDLANFKTVNEIYGSYFKAEPPARATVQVCALPLKGLVEMDMVARK